MNYELKLDIGFLNLILSGLAQLPFKDSAQAISAIQNEMKAQEMKAKGSIRDKGEPAPENDKPRRGRKPRVANGAAEAQPAQ